MENFIRILEISIWPSIVLIGILLFKRDLRKVLCRINSVETSIAKMNFNEELDEISDKMSELEHNSNGNNFEWINDMLNIAKINPRAAIIEAWTAIEVKCLEIGMFSGSSIRRFNYKELEEYLHAIPNFSDKMIMRVMDLRRLRNQVVHGIETDLDYINADKYIMLANRTLNALKEEL